MPICKSTHHSTQNPTSTLVSNIQTLASLPTVLDKHFPTSPLSSLTIVLVSMLLYSLNLVPVSGLSPPTGLKHDLAVIPRDYLSNPIYTIL